MEWQSVRRFDDPREHVAKFVFTKDDAIAEAVLYRYPTYAERTVICCSVQSGCPVGCVFCGTGKKFIRSLTVDEICDQVKYALGQVALVEVLCPPSRMKRLQVMFMSMGEPMLNPRIFQAIRRLHRVLPNAELLVSTIGPRSTHYGRLLQVSRDIDKVGLQFSIHATMDEERDKLIPFKAKMNLWEIATFGEEWHNATKRPPFFNYIATQNTTEADADRLTALFNPAIWRATVSVLCATDGQPRQEDSSRATWFANTLLSKGFSTRVFNPAGQDTIGGGCGQLWFVQDWMKENGREKTTEARCADA